VINTNLPPILHRFQVMADYWSNFRKRQGVALLYSLGYISVSESIGVSSTTFT